MTYSGLTDKEIQESIKEAKRQAEYATTVAKDIISKREVSRDDILKSIKGQTNSLYKLIYLLDLDVSTYLARKDHWVKLKKKCENDPMFSDLWNELMVLLRLEE